MILPPSTLLLSRIHVGKEVVKHPNSFLLVLVGRFEIVGLTAFD